jgi:hypothetical protein
LISLLSTMAINTSLHQTLARQYMSHLITTLAIFLICSACATKTLWKHTNPEEYVSIRYSEITEEKLKEEKIEYIKDDTYGVFYVKKSAMLKLKDYTLRVFLTPITVVVDATIGTVVIVGSVLFQGLSVDAEHRRSRNCSLDPDCRRTGGRTQF